MHTYGRTYTQKYDFLGPGNVVNNATDSMDIWDGIGGQSVLLKLGQAFFLVNVSHLLSKKDGRNATTMGTIEQYNNVVYLEGSMHFDDGKHNNK
jgi:hypothetical protein